MKSQTTLRSLRRWLPGMLSLGLPVASTLHAANVDTHLTRPPVLAPEFSIICRSSINAPDQHDADYATFHRVKNFRQLALDLFPAAEN